MADEMGSWGKEAASPPEQVEQPAGGGGPAEAVSPPVEGQPADPAADNRTERADPPLREWWDQHPEMFKPPRDSDPRPEIDGPGTDPASWVDRINPRGPHPVIRGGEFGREDNCVDCTRAVERTWRGDPEVSAASLDRGEPRSGLELWSGSDLQPVTFGEIELKLLAGGHGSSAMIFASLKEGSAHAFRGSAHAFNALNFEGRIVFVDGQPEGGVASSWPPTKESPGWKYEEAEFRLVVAIIRGPDKENL